MDESNNTQTKLLLCNNKGARVGKSDKMFSRIVPALRNSVASREGEKFYKLGARPQGHFPFPVKRRARIRDAAERI